MGETATGETLILQRPGAINNRRAVLLFVLLMLVQIVVGVAMHELWRDIVSGGTSVVVIGLSLVPSSTEISRAGIRNRWAGRFGRSWSWDEIEAVVQPKSADQTALLLMTNTDIREVRHSTPTDAEAIAAIGGKEIRPVDRYPHAGEVRHTSADDEHLAVIRRADAVSAEAERLNAQLRRIRGER